VWGFDPDMLRWGVEDLDFSLKCWLAGQGTVHTVRVMEQLLAAEHPTVYDDR
jgi:hypothetical protein